MNDKRKFKIYGAICWIAAIVWFIAMIMSESVVFIAISIVLAIAGYILWAWEFPAKEKQKAMGVEI
jgi:Flp pilus assembly protein TadB